MKVTQQEIAYIQKVTARTINNWVKNEGFPTEQLDGKTVYDPADCLEWRIARETGGSYSAERTRLTREQADRAEIENAKLRGDLVDINEVEKAWLQVSSVVRQRVMAIPRTVTPVLVGKDEAAIENELESECRAALDGVADEAVSGELSDTAEADG